jgi:[NiFe] hydrogenase assembly HybE family chaperone
MAAGAATPWFMNLVCLPMDLTRAGETVPGVRKRPAAGSAAKPLNSLRARGGVGAFACCSLFSPMFEFADHAAAVATARAVLNLLRTPAPAPAFTSAQKPTPALDVKADAAPSRRSFLFGRGGPRAGVSA